MFEKLKRAMLPKYFTELVEQARASRNEKEAMLEIGEFYRRELNSKLAEQIVGGCLKIRNDAELKFYSQTVTRLENFRNGLCRKNYLKLYEVDFDFLTEVFICYHRREGWGQALETFFGMYGKLKAHGIEYQAPQDFYKIFCEMRYYDADPLLQGLDYLKNTELDVDDPSSREFWNDPRNRTDPEYLRLCLMCSLDCLQRVLQAVCSRDGSGRKVYEDNGLFAVCDPVAEYQWRYLVWKEPPAVSTPAENPADPEIISENEVLAEKPAATAVLAEKPAPEVVPTESSAEPEPEVVFDVVQDLSTKTSVQGETTWRVGVYKPGKWVLKLYKMYELWKGEPFDLGMFDEV